MAEPNHDPTSPEPDGANEEASELRASESLQRYLKGATNRPATNARVVDSEAEIEEPEKPGFNATDFLGLNAEVTNLMEASESDPGHPPAPLPGATEAQEGDENWLLNLDDQTAEEAGRRPLLSDPSREAELAVAQEQDASFVEPELPTSAAGRHGLKLIAAVTAVAAGLAIWRMVADDAFGDGTPQTVDVELAQGERSGMTEFGVEAQRQGLQADGTWRTVPSGDVAPGMAGNSSGEESSQADGGTESALAENGAAGAGDEPDPEALAVLEAFDALIEGEQSASTELSGALGSETADGAGERSAEVFGLALGQEHNRAGMAGALNLSAAGLPFTKVGALAAELYSRQADAPLWWTLRAPRKPAGEAPREPWEFDQPLADYIHPGLGSGAESERYASAAEDGEPQPFVGLASILGLEGLTFADAERLERDGMPDPVQDAVDPLQTFVVVAEREVSEDELVAELDPVELHVDPLGEQSDDLAGELAGEQDSQVAPDARDPRAGRLLAGEYGAWMLFGEAPGEHAFARGRDDETELAAEFAPDAVASTEVEVMTEDGSPTSIDEGPDESSALDREQVAEAYPESSGEDELDAIAGAPEQYGTEDDPFAANPRRRFSVLRRVEDVAQNHYFGVEVPLDLIDEPNQVFTPRVGVVHVETQSGEVFIGRLTSVGHQAVWLQAEPGKLALKGAEVASVRRVDLGGRPWPSSWQLDPNTSGLPQVRVRVAGGYLEGRLFAQERGRVTLITEDGGRITVKSDEVQPAGKNRPTSTIKGRVDPGTDPDIDPAAE